MPPALSDDHVRLPGINKDHDNAPLQRKADMSDEKKIIIDEDWKSQVQAEKEAAEQAASDSSTSAAGAESGAAPAADADGSRDDDPPMPPASLEMLLTTLATEAMLAMGQMPHPATGESAVRKNQAKYLIDTIEVLKDKTAGNLDVTESQAIETLLHQLRMAFLTIN